MRTISYDPLWKLLIDRGLKKGELAELAGLSRSTMTQLNQNKSVTLQTLLSISEKLDCEVYDIVEFRKS